MKRQDPYARLERQSLATHPAVQQPGRVSEPKVVLAENERWTQLFKLFMGIHGLLEKMVRKTYDYECFVDEYEVIGVAQANVNVRKDFQADVQYESILYSLPLGTTTAVLTIGTRNIPLYSGTAITVQQAQFLEGLVIQAAADDRNTLAVGGATTTVGYIGLMGHTIKKGK